MPWLAIAYRFERELHEAYAALGCLPPTYEPRPTGHVPEMIEMIKVLIDRGHAYPAADGSGDVYFDVKSWPAYGSLSRQKIDDMEAATDSIRAVSTIRGTSRCGRDTRRPSRRLPAG